MTAANEAWDVIEDIPDPETVDRLLADAIRRADLLRQLLKVSRRKAAYRNRPCPATDTLAQQQEAVIPF